MLDRFIGSLETRARYSTLTDAPSATLRQDSVYSGLDAGAALVPVLVGWMLDRGHAAMVFLMVGIELLLGVGTVIQVKQRSAPGTATTQPQGS